MANPRYVSQWPTAGERHVSATLQYATPTIDALGGRSEPIWSDFGTWWVKVATVPFVINETQATIGYEVEGNYRRDVWTYFRSGTGLRIVVTSPSLTLKVFQIENPQLKNRTLIAHCADAVNTQ